MEMDKGKDIKFISLTNVKELLEITIDLHAY